MISFAPEELEKVRSLAVECPFEVIGKVGGQTLKIAVDGETSIEEPISDLESIWTSALESRL